MTNIVNFERDMMWPVSLVTTAPVVSAFSGNVGCGAPAAVNQRVSSAYSTNFVTTAASQWQSIGCLMLPPVEGDVTPYRFQGFYDGPNTCVFGYGYFDSATFRAEVIVGAGKNMDGVIAIAPLDAADPDFGRPLVFFASVFNGVAFNANRSGVYTQRLVSKPPQFASAVS